MLTDIITAVYDAYPARPGDQAVHYVGGAEVQSQRYTEQQKRIVKRTGQPISPFMDKQSKKEGSALEMIGKMIALMKDEWFVRHVAPDYVILGKYTEKRAFMGPKSQKHMHPSFRIFFGFP